MKNLRGGGSRLGARHSPSSRFTGVVAVAATVIDDDVALAVGGLGHERRGWGVSRGTTDRFGIVCRRFRGVWDWFGAGEVVVVVVVDDVVVVDGVDGGCADVVVGDVAMSGGVPECVSRVCVAVSVVLGVTWVLKSAVEIVVIWERAFSSSCDGSL